MRHPKAIRLPALVAPLLLCFPSHTQARFSQQGGSNVAVYWGQASGGMQQQNLSEYCADSNIDIIPMAFLCQMNSGPGGEPVIDFSSASKGCELFNGTGLLSCPDIGKDITTCQEKFNKTILLSIGGATYTEGGFTTADIAKQSANKIWNMFGPRQSNSSTLRPFGNAFVNGFDFDFESVTTNMVPFGQELRSLMDQRTSMTGQKFMLTAAPQCPFPDAADNDMLDGQVAFDAIFIQFYNNFCGVQAFQPDAANQTAFNYDVWDDWAKTKSKNKGVKLFVGIPAGPTAAGTGYTPAAGLKPVIEYAKGFDSFGGVMMWDVSQAYANQGFLPEVKSALVQPKRRRRAIRHERRSSGRIVL